MKAKLVWPSSDTSRKTPAKQTLKEAKDICRKPRGGRKPHGLI